MIKLSVGIAAYGPLRGSCHVKTPRDIVLKYCVLDIQNNDQYCFLYCAIAHIHHIGKNADRVNSYISYLKELNYQGLSYPLKVSYVAKFETKKPEISVNVLCYEKKNIRPLYSTPHRGRKHCVNLLLLDSQDMFHYTLIFCNMSRFVSKRTARNGNSFVGPY